ncbi:MAG: hypothetical protein ACE5EP_04770, partial [Candidatus Methylomirabilales bacterium]
MRKVVFALWLAFAFTLAFAVSPGVAFECPDLYAECQELLKTKKNKEAEKLCEEGIKLHEAGNHDASVETLE